MPFEKTFDNMSHRKPFEVESDNIEISSINEMYITEIERLSTLLENSKLTAEVKDVINQTIIIHLKAIQEISLSIGKPI